MFKNLPKNFSNLIEFCRRGGNFLKELGAIFKIWPTWRLCVVGPPKEGVTKP